MPGELQCEEWFLFRIPVGRILEYLERKSGTAFVASPSDGPQSHRWHLALREGLRSRLHLNVGIPGIEEPANPVEENASALQAALLLRIPVLEVVLSGEWEVAVREGLISQEQKEMHEQALHRAREEPEALPG